MNINNHLIMVTYAMLFHLKYKKKITGSKQNIKTLKAAILEL